MLRVSAAVAGAPTKEIPAETLVIRVSKEVKDSLHITPCTVLEKLVHWVPAAADIVQQSSTEQC